MKWNCSITAVIFNLGAFFAAPQASRQKTGLSAPIRAFRAPPSEGNASRPNSASIPCAFRKPGIAAIAGLALLVFFSCSGGPAFIERAFTGGGSPPEQRFWITPADGQGLVIIGAAARRMDRDESLVLALEDAARKVAIFDQVTGIIQRREIQQSGFMGYSSDIQSEIISPQDYRGYVESMEYNLETDILEQDNAVFIRVRFPSFPGHSIPYRAVREGAQPGWILKPPVIPGFYTGVGHSGPHYNIRDAINSAYENAIFTIIESISLEVSFSHEHIDSGIYSSQINRATASRATLNGFYILETWIDPATKAVWTLGVAKRAAEAPLFE